MPIRWQMTASFPRLFRSFVYLLALPSVRHDFQYFIRCYHFSRIPRDDIKRNIQQFGCNLRLPSRNHPRKRFQWNLLSSLRERDDISVALFSGLRECFALKLAFIIPLIKLFCLRSLCSRSKREVFWHLRRNYTHIKCQILARRTVEKSANVASSLFNAIALEWLWY